MEVSRSEATVLHYLWLQRIFPPGNRMGGLLLSHFGGDIDLLYRAEREDYQRVGDLEPSALDGLCNKDLTDALQISAYCRNNAIRIMVPTDPDFPDQLCRIPAPPLVLYVRGTLPDLRKTLSVSIVGTRSMTEYGSQNTYLIAYDLTKAGAIIVSGMAKGIDGIAHRGCLDAGGITVAVLGCGVDRCYPTEHENLRDEILRRGAVLSEFPPFTPPSGRNFPIRNRLISALSLATLVTEADETSGALITARNAVLQGRALFALPGKVGEKNSQGVNHLLREGAVPITCAMDLLLPYRKLYPKALRISAVPHPGIRSKRIKSPIKRQTPLGERTFGGYEAYEARQMADGIDDRPLPPPDAVAAAEAANESRAEAPAAEPKPKRELPPLSENEQRLLDHFPTESAITADELSESGLPIHQILIDLTTLEIKGVIESVPGNAYRRV